VAIRFGCTTEDTRAEIDTLASPPSHEEQANETGEVIIDELEYSPEEEAQYFIKNPVSDFMVDVRVFGVYRNRSLIMAEIRSLNF